MNDVLTAARSGRERPLSRRHERVGRMLVARHREQVEDVLARAATALGWPEPVPGPVSERVARRELDRAWRETTTRLARQQVPPAAVPALVELLGDIRACEHAVPQTQAIEQSAARERVRDALAELRTVPTMTELVRQAPQVASHVGFDRVLLSRIQDATWLPESMFVPGNERWAREILEAGRANPRKLDRSLLESRIPRFDRALLVPNVEGTGRLHPELIEVTRSRSYAAAPISIDGDVVGMMHADCYHQDRTMRYDDRDLLWLFTDGLGHIAGRVAVAEAAAQLRKNMRELLGTPPATYHFGHLGLVAAPRPRQDEVRPADHVTSALTPRERDVIRLMSEGCTNSRTARRLMITEGTVKSHVKHILEKLHAANRAEAVAIWLGASGRPAPSRAG